MKAKELMRKTGLSWEAIASQLPNATQDTELDPALEAALLARFAQGDRGSGRRDLKPANPEPTLEEEVSRDLIELTEENKITIEDAILVSELHRVTLEYVVNVAETLTLDETVLGFLRGYVQQQRIIAAEQTGRAAAIAKHNSEKRSALDEEEAKLDQFGLAQFQERTGFSLQRFFDDQAKEEKKYQAKPKTELRNRVLAVINNGV